MGFQKNKKSFTFLFALCFFVAFMTPLSAAEGTYGDLKRSLKDVRQLFQADKAEISIDELKMSKKENKAFWPVYNSYTSELKQIENKMFKLIAGYADNVENLSNVYADKMMKDYFIIESSKLDILEKYVTKFKKILHTTKVAKLYQIENKLTAVNDLGIAASVPLIK